MSIREVISNHRDPGARRQRFLSNLGACMFVAPHGIGLILFVIIPIIMTAVLSLFEWDLISSPRFAGLASYARIISDPMFWNSAKNTVVFTLGTVPTGVVLALLLALLVDNRLKGIVLFRSAMFMPVLSSWVVVAMIWRWLYNPQFGLINRILSVFGVTGPAWLSDLRWAMPAVIITTVWKFLGYNMIIYLAGLQGVPDAYYEAASIDGANRWQRLWYITIPLLSPVTFFITVVSLIGAFQAFPQFYMMTRGGPARCTNVIVYYIYENAFLWFKMGYASALAWVLFLVVFGLTLLQWRLQSRWVQYD